MQISKLPHALTLFEEAGKLIIRPNTKALDGIMRGRIIISKVAAKCIQDADVKRQKH